MEKGLRMDRPAVLSERPPFPRNMLVELTNSCNHQCVFCGYKNMKRKKRQCEKEFMFDIIRQAYENGTREIGFYMIGEPFMCPDLDAYVAHASRLGFEYIYLTTNGAMAALGRVRKVVQAGLSSIKFSVNAATRETYKAVHGKDDFMAVKENIRAIRGYLLEENIDLPMYISFVKNEINKNDVGKLYKEFDQFVDKIYIFSCGNQGGGMLDLVSSGIVREDEFAPGTTAPCKPVFNRLHVTCEGYLDACCVDVNGYLAAVDLHKATLKDAWDSEIMVSLRRKHLQNDLEHVLCYNCVNNVNEEVLPLNEGIMAGLYKCDSVSYSE